MNHTDLIKRMLVTLAFLLLVVSDVQGLGYNGLGAHDSYYGDYGYDYAPINDYPSAIDYHHGYSGPSYYYGNSSNRHINFGKRFDNSDNFTSGVSSYQGTSTGPGPNGGYPGTPHGIYQTNYYDTSIYPNTYMR